jgi:hypothetical protein
MTNLSRAKNFVGAVFTGILVIFPQVEGAGKQTTRSYEIGNPPQTLEQLSDGATWIVDARVQSVFDATQIANRYVETDAFLSVERVLKGTGLGQSIVVGQASGQVDGGIEVVSPQFSLMKPGERYILFLRSMEGSVNGGQPRPQRSAPRYSIYLVYVGLAKVEGEQTIWSSGMSSSWRNTYNGRNVADVIATILARVKPN